MLHLFRRYILPALSLLVLCAGCTSTRAPEPVAAGTAASVAPSEILWDEWGVPHIYGATQEDVAYGYGWAQMRNHGDAILRLYGQARGEAAAYWGADHLETDRLMHRLGIPRVGGEALAAQPEAFQRYLRAFADGMNAYAAAHPDALADDTEVVLPVRPEDVLQHGQRLLFTFVALTGNQPPLVGLDGKPIPTPGSNTWAIGPERSASGHAMLLQNPHLPWHYPFMRFFEAHLVAGETDVYGATLIGLPIVVIGFNEHLGWSHTVNTVDALDTYELQLDGDAYRFDGTHRPLTSRQEVLRVRQPDGTLAADTLRIERSVHGPVIQRGDSTALAVRAPVLERFGALHQWWAMGQARDADAFEAALRQLEVPMFTVTYADRAGHISYLFNGQVPQRAMGDFAFWQQAVPGDTSATLWTEVHAFDDLPRVEDPASGFVQNANSPPWFATVPSPLDPSAFPSYMAPMWMLNREVQSLNLLLGDASITFDELVAMRYANRMLLADRVLGDLLPAARASEDAVVREAADVLADWDRTAAPESRGALLFAQWVRQQCRGPVSDFCAFATPWDPERPVETPRGLSDPEAAVARLAEVAAAMKAQFGRLDVPWGEVMRISDELAGTGASGDPFGVFHVITYAPVQEGVYRPVHGDTWVAALEFAPDGPRGQVLLPYGNATQPGSPHVDDQLGLLARQQMRPLWRSRADVEAHTVERTPLR